jgi:hypothetical protein
MEAVMKQAVSAGAVWRSCVRQVLPVEAVRAGGGLCELGEPV